LATADSSEFIFPKWIADESPGVIPNFWWRDISRQKGLRRMTTDGSRFDMRNLRLNLSVENVAAAETS
jgi:hypothetical protein